MQGQPGTSEGGSEDNREDTPPVPARAAAGLVLVSYWQYLKLAS